MAYFLNVCRFNPTAGGTTDWTYSSAITGYQSPTAAGVVNGRLYKYRAESTDLTQWELGEGAYNTGTGVLARTTVLFNSSGTGTGAGQSGAGSKINFSAAPTVAIVALAEDMVSIAGNTGAFTLTGGITNATNAIKLSLDSAVLSGHPSNPTGTTAASPGVMMGLGVTTLRFTPTYSSRVEFAIQGQVANSSVAATAMRLYYGTGAGPANAAATTGTATGGGYITYSSTAANANLGFNISEIVTGLSPGTTYWFDLSVFVNGGTGTITNVTGTAKEIL